VDPSDQEFSLAWQMEAYSPTAPTDPGIVEWSTSPPLEVRCDNIVSGMVDGRPVAPGCVFDAFIPHMEYSVSVPYPELAGHIALAVEFGLTPNPRLTPLTRTMNSEYNQLNRSRAFRSSYPRPEGESCDEFPFASTQEGAYLIDPDGSLGYGAVELPECEITVSNPVDPWSEQFRYNVCMIDEVQNRDGGRALQTFYVVNRVIEYDEFYVDMTA
jgi:hypothetical protein